MSAVVISHVPQTEYPSVQAILRKVFKGQESPTWAALVEHGAVEGDEVVVLVWPKHVSFVSPSRARAMFAGCPRLSEQEDGTWKEIER
jgi:hypothetical protein